MYSGENPNEVLCETESKMSPSEQTPSSSESDSKLSGGVGATAGLHKEENTPNTPNYSTSHSGLDGRNQDGAQRESFSDFEIEENSRPMIKDFNFYLILFIIFGQFFVSTISAVLFKVKLLRIL